MKITIVKSFKENFGGKKLAELLTLAVIEQTKHTYMFYKKYA